MGDDEATSVSTSSSSGQRRSQLDAEGITRDHTWRTTDTGTAHGRPFKRRATPAPIAGQTGTGQNARAAKRLRRCAQQASKRSGGGFDRSRDSDGIDSGAIPEQHLTFTNEDERSAGGSHEFFDECISEYGRGGERKSGGAATDGVSKADESDMLW